MFYHVRAPSFLNPAQEKAALNPSGALLYRWSLRNTTRSSRDRPRETTSLTREDSTLSSQRIFLLGRVWPHQTFTVTIEGSAHALPFLPYLLMVALHHDTIIQTSSQENSTLSVHSAPSAFMPVQRGTAFTPQRSGFASSNDQQNIFVRVAMRPVHGDAYEDILLIV